MSRKSGLSRDVALTCKGKSGKIIGGAGFFFGSVVEVSGCGNYLRFKRGGASGRFAPEWKHRGEVWMHDLQWKYRKGRVWGELLHAGEPVLRDDFDTSPSESFIYKLWVGVCDVLNGTGDSPPVLLGEWRYSNGVVCCGTLRIASLPMGVERGELSEAQTERLSNLVERLNEHTKKWSARRSLGPAEMIL